MDSLLKISYNLYELENGFIMKIEKTLPYLKVYFS